ncbi:hypothetical protein HMI55_003428, partial [Coelomomyces lativittatus]
MNMQRSNDKIYCKSPQSIEKDLLQKRMNIEKSMNSFEGELDTKLNEASILSKLIDFLDNPRAEKFNSILPFLTKHAQLYVPKGENEFTQIFNKALDSMKSYFSKFLKAIHEVLKASKNLNLHTSEELKKVNDENLKLEFKDMKIIFKCALYFQLDFEQGIQYLYRKYPSKKSNIHHLKNLFQFYVFNFQEVLQYLLYFEYRNYCLKFSHFTEFQEFQPSSSSVNPIRSGPAIEPYYQMRLFTILNYKSHDRELQEMHTPESSLKCDPKISQRLFKDFKQSRIAMIDYTEMISAFLESNTIQIDGSIAEQESEELQKMAVFIYHSFRTILNEMPDTYEELKDYLSDYLNLFQTFLEEVKNTLHSVKIYNSKKDFKKFESYFSEKIHFRMGLHDDVLFVKWGPALNTILLKKKLKSAIDNEIPFLENLLSI